MKRQILAVALAIAIAAGFLPAQQRTLTSLAAIRMLTNAEAAGQIPVEFEATVTYYRDYERTLFVQDGDADGALPDRRPGDRYAPGTLLCRAGDDRRMCVAWLGERRDRPLSRRRIDQGLTHERG